MRDIEREVNNYRAKLLKEVEDIEEYKKLFGRDPCCAKMASTWRSKYPCTCWQDRW